MIAIFLRLLMICGRVFLIVVGQFSAHREDKFCCEGIIHFFSCPDPFGLKGSELEGVTVGKECGEICSLGSSKQRILVLHSGQSITMDAYFDKHRPIHYIYYQQCPELRVPTNRKTKSSKAQAKRNVRPTLKTRSPRLKASPKLETPSVLPKSRESRIKKNAKKDSSTTLQQSMSTLITRPSRQSLINSKLRIKSGQYSCYLVMNTLTSTLLWIYFAAISKAVMDSSSEKISRLVQDFLLSRYSQPQKVAQSGTDYL